MVRALAQHGQTVDKGHRCLDREGRELSQRELRIVVGVWNKGGGIAKKRSVLNSDRSANAPGMGSQSHFPEEWEMEVRYVEGYPPR